MPNITVTNQTAEWIEYTITGPIETYRYRTNPKATVTQYWLAQAVPGMARAGWNVTRSARCCATSRQVLRDLGLRR